MSFCRKLSTTLLFKLDSLPNNASETEIQLPLYLDWGTRTPENQRNLVEYSPTVYTVSMVPSLAERKIILSLEEYWSRKIFPADRILLLMPILALELAPSILYLRHYLSPTMRRILRLLILARSGCLNPFPPQLVRINLL